MAPTRSQVHLKSSQIKEDGSFSNAAQNAALGWNQVPTLQKQIRLTELISGLPRWR